MYVLQLHMTHFHFPNLKQNFTSEGMILSDATKYLKSIYINPTIGQLNF